MVLKKGSIKEFFDRQNGKCAICQREFIGSGHIDHDHETNIVRGLLCKSCNTAIGFFKENSESMRRAAEYIENWKVRQSDLAENEP